MNRAQRVLGAALLMVSASVLSQPASTKATPKVQKPTRSVPESAAKNLNPASEAAFVEKAVPKGPMGIGDIKIGATKAEILTLPASAPVSLDGRWSPRRILADDTPLKRGEEKFVGSVVIQGRSESLSANWTFMDDRLTEFAIMFVEGSDLFGSMGRQISEMYGEGIVADSRREENCIYRNGNSFKITSGMLVTTWKEALAGEAAVVTTLVDNIAAQCPANLSRGMTSRRMRLLSFVLRETPPPTAPKLF